MPEHTPRPESFSLNVVLPPPTGQHDPAPAGSTGALDRIAPVPAAAPAPVSPAPTVSPVPMVNPAPAASFSAVPAPLTQAVINPAPAAAATLPMTLALVGLPGAPAGTANPAPWTLLWFSRRIASLLDNRTPTIGTPDVVRDSENGKKFHIVVPTADSDADKVTTTVVKGPAHGTVTRNADGSYVYVADASYSGTDSFVVQASDAAAGLHIHGLGGLLSAIFGGSGGHTSTATVTIDVSGGPLATTNTPPTASPPNAATGTITGSVAPMVSGGTAPITFTGPANQTSAKGGSVVVNSDGTYTYTPTADMRHAASAVPQTSGFTTFALFTAPDDPTADTFDVIAHDAQGGTAALTVPVTISPQNAAPTATPQTPSLPGKATGAVSGVVAMADADHDPLTVTIGGTGVTQTTTPGTYTTPNGTLVFDSATGAYTYTPTSAARLAATVDGAPPAGLSDSFTVTVNDGHSGITTQSVTVAIPSAKTTIALPGTPIGGPAITASGTVYQLYSVTTVEPAPIPGDPDVETTTYHVLVDDPRATGIQTIDLPADGGQPYYDGGVVANGDNANLTLWASPPDYYATTQHVYGFATDPTTGAATMTHTWAQGVGGASQQVGGDSYFVTTLLDSSMQNGTTTVWKANDGAAATEVKSWAVTGPTYSSAGPDGRFYLVNSDYSASRTTVLAVDPVSGDTVPLDIDGTPTSQLHWSDPAPDGSRTAYLLTRNNDTNTSYVTAIEARPGGGPESRTLQLSSGDWLSDANLSVRAHGATVTSYTVTILGPRFVADGTDYLLVAPNLPADADTRFVTAPDGTVYTMTALDISNIGAPVNAYVIPPGGTAVSIAIEGVQTYSPMYLGPDGRGYLVTIDGPDTKLWIVDETATAASPITVPGLTDGVVIFGPDGATYFTTGTTNAYGYLPTTLNVVDPTTHALTSTPLPFALDYLGSVDYSSLQFADDGTAYLVPQYPPIDSDGNTTVIARIDPHTRTASTLTLHEAPVYGNYHEASGITSHTFVQQTFDAAGGANDGSSLTIVRL